MDIDPVSSDSLSHKLQSLSTSQIPSSISNLSESSRVLPTEKDFHFYYNFDEFRAPVDEINSKSHSMLQQIGFSKSLFGGKELNLPTDFEDDAYDWLVNVNDEILERFDMSIDEFSTLRKAKEEGIRVGNVVDEEGFQLVCGKKKKKKEMREKEEEEESVVPRHHGVKVAERSEKIGGGKAKVPFHIPTIMRPQEEYNILVNNGNEPFQHVWLERSEDGSRVVHPLEKLSVLDFVDRNSDCLEPEKPLPLESTPCKLVEDVQDLKELASTLCNVNEFAVDLEHNHYRSFQGLTCLMQISTRSEDFLVDTLKLRIHVGPYLREVFKDPSIRKVMHGADRDIMWLQRDFGIYLCNVFDTGQASRVLHMERNSLEYLLQHFCGVTANKEYQNADWRLRPLPDEMIRYAREDTHYLLYIYDLMRIRLLAESNLGNSDALLEVYKRSYDVCMQLYEKEFLSESSYLYIYGVQGANLNAQQLSIVAGLCRWRDAIARAEDESTGYVLPNKMLLEIAKQMPLTTSKLRRLVRSKHPFVERNLGTVVNIIKHSIQNASSFEAVAAQLKEGQIQVPELPDTGAEFPEDHGARNHYEEDADGNKLEHVPSSSISTEEPTDNDLNPNRAGVSLEGTSKKDNIKKNCNDDTSHECQRECTSFLTPKTEMDASGPHLEKVAKVTVQVSKKPNRAFGALLGSFGSKKKTDRLKEKADKLDQIKSSVNLPFYSFQDMDQQLKQPSKQALEERNTASSTSVAVSVHCMEEVAGTLETHPISEGGIVAPASSTKLEDVILMDDDSLSDGEAPPDNTNQNDQGPSKSEMAVEDEDDAETMSLAELSSSFKKCLHQNQTTMQGGEAKGGFPQFKPFDYEAARREVKFGEDVKRKVKPGEGNNDGKIVGKKKGGGQTDWNKQDGSALPQGKRRQAFPASGNRSATFR